MGRRPSASAAGVVAAVTLAVLYGSSYAATAFQLRGFTPLAGGFWRSLAGAALLVTLTAGVRLRRPPATSRPRAREWRPSAPRLLTLGLLGGPIFIVGMNVAVSQLGAAVTAFVAGLYAIVAALFAPVIVAERLGRGPLLGFALAVAGTALLAGLAPSADATLGFTAAAVAAVSFGLYLVLLRRWSGRSGMDPLLVATAVAVASAVTLGLLAVSLEPAALIPGRLGSDALLATGWLVLVTCAGPVLGTISLGRIETRMAAALLLLNPLTATVLAVAMLGERLSPAQIAGAAFVLVGMGAAGRRDPSARRVARVRTPGAAETSKG